MYDVHVSLCFRAHTLQNQGRKYIPECIDQSAALSTSIQNKKMLLLLHLPFSKINFQVVASLWNHFEQIITKTDINTAYEMNIDRYTERQMISAQSHDCYFNYFAHLDVKSW